MKSEQAGKQGRRVEKIVEVEEGVRRALGMIGVNMAFNGLSEGSR